MDHTISQLAKMAQEKMDEADCGKEYTIAYVQQRIEDAIDESQPDQVLLSMAQVIEKMSAKGKFSIAQKELYSIYNAFAGLNRRSEAKEVLADLIFVKKIATEEVPRTNEYRTPEQALDISIAHNPLDNLFDNKSIVSYYDASLAKIGKTYIEQELIKIKTPADKINVFAGNDQAIVYDVVFTNKLGTAHVAIPLEIAGGIHLPDSFIGGGEVIELTAENLNKYIINSAKDESIELQFAGGMKTSSSVVSADFTFDNELPTDIQLPAAVLPENLQAFANFENTLLDASTNFSPNVVKTAKAMCERELASMGFNAYVKLAEATDTGIICSAELNSTAGKVEIKMPVEIYENRPQLPGLFYHAKAEDKVYDFTKSQLVGFLTAATADRSMIKRYGGDLSHADLHQLKDELLSGVASKDYVRCETALNIIEDKFGADAHKIAMNDYTSMLKTATSMASAPKHKCALLLTRGSMEPRCGHYNVAISRVSYDEDGNCVLAERQAKYDNLMSSGASMSTNKIKLT